MKKTNENLVILITLFAISIVIANVTGARTITTGLHIGPIELALSGGAITYAVTFLCTDIIGEIWGKATAQRVVKYGFIGQIFATACIMITGVFPATDAVMDNAYQTLLGQNWIFVIGSLSAYLVSQSWDVAVFHAIRDRYIAKHGSTKGGRWLWNNGSTITSQIWDTVIYAVISFGFGLGWVHTHEGRMQLIGIMEGYLKNIKTTTGDYIYRDEMNAGNFLGMPYKVSNQIPTDSKTGCTEMFFGNWADLMIGDQMGLETYTTLDGTWTDENGVQHNAFEENLTGTRALMYDDIGVRHVESFAYVHNIKVI